MKDYNSDSTVVLDRFARDKRKRTTTAERIERRPGPRRDADDTPREHAPRRASYNPHFTEDNRPVDERPRRPSGGSRYGEGRPSGPYRGRPDGPRSDRSGGYGGERSAAEDRPRPYGKKPFGASKYGDKPAYGRKSAGKFGFKRPYGEQEGDFRHGERAGAPKRYGPKSAGGFKRDDRRGEVRPKSYPRYNPNVQTGEIRLNRFIAQSGLCSRREADDYIQAGLVSVNGVIVTELGSKVKPTDEVKFNDSRIEGEKKVYLVLNKPKGYVTSLEDPHADKTVMDLVKGACEERIYPVGRLDPRRRDRLRQGGQERDRHRDPLGAQPHRAAHLRVAGLLGAQTRPRLLRRPYEEESQTRRMALPDQGGGDASQKRPVRIARLPCRYRMAPQLTAEEFFVAAGKPVEQCVEMGRVVVVDGVAEFVQQYEVAQMRG